MDFVVDRLHTHTHTHTSVPFINHRFMFYYLMLIVNVFLIFDIILFCLMYPAAKSVKNKSNSICSE